MSVGCKSDSSPSARVHADTWPSLPHGFVVRPGACLRQQPRRKMGLVQPEWEGWDGVDYRFLFKLLPASGRSAPASGKVIGVPSVSQSAASAPMIGLS